MSTTTDKLALFKYDPSTDGAQTFNIQKALNENWDKLDDAVKEILITLANKANSTHAAKHAKGGADPITPESIGAAPGGFGLGKTWITAPENDANQIPGTGWFIAYQNTPTDAWWIIHAVCNNDVLYQFAYANEAASGVLMGTVAQRTQKGANYDWSPWEYVNPPLKLGIEYRTTARYLGKPVYTKVVDCGNLLDGTTKEVAHGIANVDIVVGAQAIASNSTTGFNGHAYLPDIYNGSLTDRWTTYLAGVNAQNIRLFCGSGLAGCPVYVTLKYTKTTV